MTKPMQYEILEALRLPHTINVVEKEHFNSCYSVSDLATSSIGCVGSAIALLKKNLGLSNTVEPVTVNQRLASLWFGMSIKPINWQLPPIWDEIAGDYQTQDGWIKLHTNLPHHKKAVLSVLRSESTKSAVKKAVSVWKASELEQYIADAGGVAAKMRSAAKWSAHAQAKALSNEPLVHLNAENKAEIRNWQATLNKPLNGLRVLDLTRVLAGPVATRTLAGFGAQVLRIDPPLWDEANIVPDIILGKRCRYLNLTKTCDQANFESLLSQADVLVHGYRADALEKLGYGNKQRRSLNPNLVDVSLNAYGWSGPWSNRRGFDSLVQMATGIAHAGMLWKGKNIPTPLPVQALDHATGYLMAAAVISVLNKSVNGEGLYSAKLSLARTAELLKVYPQSTNGQLKQPNNEDYSSLKEQTPWGRAYRLNPPLTIGDTTMQWTLPSCKLGSSEATWHSFND